MKSIVCSLAHFASLHLAGALSRMHAAGGPSNNAAAAAAAASAAASVTSRMRFLHEMAQAALHINPSLSQFYLEALRDLASASSIDLHESFTRTICPCPPPRPRINESTNCSNLLSLTFNMQALLRPCPPSVFIHQHHFHRTHQSIRQRSRGPAASAPRPRRLRGCLYQCIVWPPLQKCCDIQLRSL